MRLNNFLLVARTLESISFAYPLCDIDQLGFVMIKISGIARQNYAGLMSRKLSSLRHTLQTSL